MHIISNKNQTGLPLPVDATSIDPISEQYMYMCKRSEKVNRSLALPLKRRQGNTEQNFISVQKLESPSSTIPGQDVLGHDLTFLIIQSTMYYENKASQAC